MTSPTQPPREPLLSRLSSRISLGGRGRAADPEERFTQNVTIGFVVLIVAVALVVVFGLLYGFWESNLRPIATVAGADVSRTQWEDRLRLEDFRLKRAESQVRTALAAGTISTELGERRLSAIALDRQNIGIETIDDLVDLVYQEQLAEDEGVELTDEELEAAVAASGSAPEFRHVKTVVILPEGREVGVTPTPQSRQEALARAEEAVAALESGTPFDEVMAEYSSLSEGELGGDLGFVERSDLSDPAWAEAIFSLEPGEVTDLIEADDDTWLIGTVVEIVPEQPDPGFLPAVAEEIGADVNRRNVELEALAAKLEAHIVADATDGPLEQVRLSEILIEGDTFVDPETDEGMIRASHILYAPGDPASGEQVPEDDPAWEAARVEAEAAAEALRAIEDAGARAEAFVERAAEESDGPTSTTGGDLGYFGREDMVPEFAAALFDAEDPTPGDIVGPVRTDFGWHVIQFTDRRLPIADRLAAVEVALAQPEADFAIVAREHSDGAEAIRGGETGWHIFDELEDEARDALADVEVGEVAGPVDMGDGYVFYLKQAQEERPLEPAQAARVADGAFFSWYQEKRFAAEDAGLIDIDRSIFQVDDPATLPQGHGG